MRKMWETGNRCMRNPWHINFSRGQGFKLARFCMAVLVLHGSLLHAVLENDNF